MSIYKLSAATLALSALCAGFVGCGGSSTTAEQGTSGDAAVASNSSQSTGSTISVVQQGVGTEPAQVVAIFLDSLRSGDEKAANSVLTNKAREELSKTDYVMQPLGDAQGKFEIGRVGYPTPEKDVALVECVWVDPPAQDGSQQSLDIVCEVRQDPAGWGISGIGVTIPGTEQALVLDFEDGAKLQATIDAATGRSAAPKTSVPAQTVSTQTNLQAQSGAVAPGQTMPNSSSNPQGLPEYSNSGSGAGFYGSGQATSVQATGGSSLQGYSEPGAANTNDGGFPDLPLPPSGGQ